ncbi:MAG: sigma-70 family RNA polymerase sigma factor [Thermoanaerobaculia bacterium]
MIDEERSDEELLKEAQRDENAFSLLVERWWNKIYSFISFKIKSPDEAKELTQEVFLKIYLNLENFNPSYKFSTWAFKIAQNLSIDYLRKQHILRTELSERSAITDKNPLSNLMEGERNRKLWDLVDKLPEEFKEVIVLRHLEELSYEEISKILNLKLGTVKNRIFKARQYLLEMMEEENEKL